MNMLKAVLPRNRRAAQSGQAIVLIALVMVALLAALGLAVDGGGLYFLRRNAQNATDAAVMEATYTICTDTGATSDEIETAGLHGAETNGFVDETLTGGTTRVEVHNPPLSGTGAGDDDYVSVAIQAEKPSYFIHLVFGGPLEVTTFAVGRCTRGRNVGNYGAIWAGSTTCNQTVDMSGSSYDITGDIFSNNEIQGNGSDITVEGSGSAAGTFTTNSAGNFVWDPSADNPEAGVDTMEDPLNLDVDDYAPGGIVAEEASDQGLYTYVASGTFSPNTGEDLEGLYFVEEDVRINHSFERADRNGDGDWDGITIVAREDIDIQPNAFNAYDAADPTANDLKHFVDGLLFYSAQVATNCGNNAISASVSAGTFTGIIYAPFSGINISYSDATGRGALIGQTVNLSGSSFVFDYVPDLVPPRAPIIGVAE
jgi:hypothetical protein